MERAKRSWLIFCLDVGKQVISALLQHLANLFLAVLLRSLIKSGGDACIWYFVTLLLDTSLGLSLCYVLHSVIDKVAVKNDIEVLKSGLYYNDRDPEGDDYIDYRIWVVQLVVWCCIVMLVKIVVFVAELFFADSLIMLGEFLLQDFKDKPRLELVFVMMIVPLTLNVVQLWIQDNFLMGQKHLEERRERLTAAEFAKLAEEYVVVDAPLEKRMSRLNR
mmetsp:Transcript_40332/g.38801  ORF Transcript_40332/g.38801 Transcript_40332/m.38801 type:complete len:219 (+) Transcript_40332:105-761(+)